MHTSFERGGVACILGERAHIGAYRPEQISIRNDAAQLPFLYYEQMMKFNRIEY
jgi:hypothetical protein